ncbi:MAG: tRNA uridine-5-carboxymethylaminomethyl(34) synthesis GTPase MnmE [Epulopiscium sp. Nele67-Bin005]|nr:MAG: tRNA uridine-5-carboxymethylaminomethyl(34) synthesis GTPase MnmE [Epulopiscium sp. Nele67-Bin005]
MFNDTIAAISTPIGIGGIGIIRVSGNDAIEIVDEIFKSPSNKKLVDMQSHTIHYGHIVNNNQQIIDEVLVMLMKAPKTFTRENVIEINCHGGHVVLENVLMQLVKHGARLAEQGEFTKRAFLNGRIDLAQVEAIMDIIEAKTELGLNQAINQLEGTLSKQIKKYQDTLIQIIARIEVSIDYPEYDDDEIISNNFKTDISQLNHELKALLQTADTGKMIRDGVCVAIIGQPNVGKSSLLNALLEEEKAIVTPIAGTTRDVIEAYLNIEGMPFLLMDTAGLRETEDIVEQIGVKKSKESVLKADILLMLIDSSRNLTSDEIELIQNVQNKDVIYVRNKIDLEPLVTHDLLKSYHNEAIIIDISAKNQLGLDEVRQQLKQYVLNNKKTPQNNAVISNHRQKESLLKAISSLDKVEEAINLSLPEDCLAIDLHDAYGFLGMVVGEALKEEIINELFGRFCLGK